jgi:hypothetical protein
LVAAESIVGVPDIIPLDVVIFNPAGNVGVIVYVYGVVPATVIDAGVNAVIGLLTGNDLVPATDDIAVNMTGAETVIFTVAAADVPPALVAVYVNESDPEYPAVGVYVIVVPTAVAVP